MINYKALVIVSVIMFMLILVLLAFLIAALTDRAYWKSNRNEWHDLCHETQIKLEELIEKFEEEKEQTPKIVYLCDKKGCSDNIECPNPECFYTFDITHAANFHSVNDDPLMWAENYVQPVKDDKEDN